MAYRIRRLRDLGASAEELKLTHQDVEERLQSRHLRSTDLVLIAGTWTTIGESIAFLEFAAPFVRREQRIRTAQGALAIFAALGALALMFFVELAVRR